MLNAGKGQQFDLDIQEEFLIANVDANGFFRVTYESHFLDQILENLKKNPQSFELEVAKLFFDYEWITKMHNEKIADFIKLFSILSSVKNWVVWKTLNESELTTFVAINIRSPLKEFVQGIYC